MGAPEVMVAGHICLDLTPTFGGTAETALGDVLEPGSLVVVGGCVVSPGGPVANTGLALLKLGVDCAFAAKVGDDAFGRVLTDRLAESGRAEGIRRVPGEHTSYTIVLAPPGVDRAFLHHPGANDTFGAEDIPFEQLETVSIFHLGYPPLLRRFYQDGGAELAEVFRRAKQQGATTSLDMTLPDPDSPGGRADWDVILRRVLPHVDIFLPSAEEAMYCLERDMFGALRARSAAEGTGMLDMLEPADWQRLGARLVDYGVGVAVVKIGHRGIYARTAAAGRLKAFGRTCPADGPQWAERELLQAAYPVAQIASATGAGDCAIAGFLAAFLRGESLERCLRFAAVAGAQNLSAHDAVSGISSFEETGRLADEWGSG